MAGVRLRAVSRTQGNNRAIKDGSIAPEGFALDFEEVPVLPQAFRRMVRGLEFDVCEMAITTYLCAKAYGKPFTALPIFLVRGLHHAAIVRNRQHGAPEPAALAGRRVGVNRGYTVTTGVWARGILADEYGLDPSRVTWVLSGDEHVSEYRPPPNVVPARNGEDVADMVATGQLAAGISLAMDDSRVAPLLPDAAEAGYRALNSRGLYPINHLVVVKDEQLEAYPRLAVALFTAFAEAKRGYVDLLAADAIGDPAPADVMYRRVLRSTGTDPLPYGIAPNRAMLETLIRYAVQQRILQRPPTLESLFAAGTHELTG